ncbi:FAD dependent oxidoreductase [Haladaptatus paucihalophilus DX253]|uniref:D-amino-acid dehydrogenase n=1 Tax=Haladaptatus paucihalophilus DX253 TaxID=797209 RepID=E7QX64_HALPU|nr:FAD-dependent oxidoreductase [Haladaptatus paucihalophilus]EFW90867.1 FAD dependent oxidoreductase [Haladaptatus paucihalophilus DX253]SHK24398.1 D-amino-acid dehydrogenase [Haladaptatus paucihalophilus DX253]
MHDAIVVGGGIVGASVAYHLARKDVDTLLVDRHDTGRATDAGAGIISPATSSRTASDRWFEFALDAAAYYPELVEHLENEQDGKTGYSDCSLLSVAVGEDEVPEYDAASERIRERQEKYDQPAPGTTEEISSSEAQSRYPPLAETRRCRAYDGAARVDARTFTGALLRAGESHGLTVLDGDVTRIDHENGAVTGVETTDGGRYESDAVAVAGGAWSPRFAESLGVSIPVEPQRGQIIHLDLGETDTSSWPILSPFHGHYMVPWPDNRVAVGATREVGSGFAPHTTAAGVHEVLGEALRVAPGLADAEIDEVRVGLRPRSADQLPVLGAVPTVEGVHLATGHGATGLQLGPYSGKLVADEMRGESVDIETFSVERFE